MYLNMIFRDGLYHADPHPGNYILLPGTVVGVVDCGMVGRIDENLRETLEDMLFAVSERDGEGCAICSCRVCSAPADISEPAFRADVSDFLAEYANQSIKEFDLGGALEQMTAIIRGYHLLLPPGVSLLLKTLIVLEGTARQLSPSFNLMELVVPFHHHLKRQRLRPRYWLAKLRRNGRELDRLLSTAPRDLNRFLDRLRTGQFEIELEASAFADRRQPARGRALGSGAISRICPALQSEYAASGIWCFGSRRVWLHRCPCHGNTSLAKHCAG